VLVDDKWLAAVSTSHDKIVNVELGCQLRCTPVDLPTFIQYNTQLPHSSTVNHCCTLATLFYCSSKRSVNARMRGCVRANE
jgi:hypothetical protein